MRHFGVSHPVIEFGKIARSDQLAKAPETAARFGQRNGQQRFMMLAHLSTFRDKTQTIKVHICATANRHVGFARRFFATDIMFDTRQRQAARWLHHGTGVLINIFDRRTDFIGGHQHHFIHPFFGQAKSFFADLLDRHPIRK